MLIVGRCFFREVARGGFSVARSGSLLLFVAFCGFFGFRSLFLTSMPVADDVHNSRVKVLRQYPTPPTTVFTAVVAARANISTKLMFRVLRNNVGPLLVNRVPHLPLATSTQDGVVGDGFLH